MTHPKVKQADCDKSVRFCRTDTAILVYEYERCKVFISSDVSYKEQFLAALKSDTIIASYFKSRFGEPVIININGISTDAASSQTYLFTIHAYPQKYTAEEILKGVLAGAGRTKYRVKTRLNINPVRPEIVHIELGDNPISM